MMMFRFQEEVVENVRQGYTGNNPGVRLHDYIAKSRKPQFCTGYGNLAPKTVMGKVVTILYALLGIPLMFIYMANIGSILATSFKYLYSKLCRYVPCNCQTSKMRLAGVRPSLQTCLRRPPCLP